MTVNLVAVSVLREMGVLITAILVAGRSQKFSALADQAKKVVTDVGSVTARIKEDPSVLLRGPAKTSPPPREPDAGNRR